MLTQLDQVFAVTVGIADKYDVPVRRGHALRSGSLRLCCSLLSILALTSGSRSMCWAVLTKLADGKRTERPGCGRYIDGRLHKDGHGTYRLLSQPIVCSILHHSSHLSNQGSITTAE